MLAHGIRTSRAWIGRDPLRGDLIRDYRLEIAWGVRPCYVKPVVVDKYCLVGRMVAGEALGVPARGEVRPGRGSIDVPGQRAAFDAHAARAGAHRRGAR